MATGTITIIGNLGAVPELIESAAGRKGATLLIAEAHRYYDNQKQEWVEEDPIWWRGSYWGAGAENLDNLKKGDRVIVIGRAKASNWVTEDGEKRSAIQFLADEVGLSTMFNEVRPIRKQREDSRAAAEPQPAGAPF